MKFCDGDRVHFIDRKGRQYPLLLCRGKVFQFSGEKIPHDDIIGQEDGTTVTLSRGSKFIVLRPTLSEYILKMPRGAQVIYPKDIGTILICGDIYPSATVVEAGIGSGALTMALLRAVGESGVVISYEVREDFSKRAFENIQLYNGKTNNLIIREQDIYNGIEEEGVDRIILDLPEPWRVVPHAVQTLRNGGIFLCYLPTILQVSTVVRTLKESGNFIHIETSETLFRTWHVEDNSVRPDHRMVAHTGFITTARKVVFTKDLRVNHHEPELDENSLSFVERGG
ncbi:MAG: tRNA (adenine-N1)-methyltransferase [Nitrospirae bacterium]|nr:tRNA (adenine-N1)-methyltransferase [Nitrospirota bacterium]